MTAGRTQISPLQERRHCYMELGTPVPALVFGTSGLPGFSGRSPLSSASQVAEADRRGTPFAGTCFLTARASHSAKTIGQNTGEQGTRTPTARVQPGSLPVTHSPRGVHSPDTARLRRFARTEPKSLDEPARIRPHGDEGQRPRLRRAEIRATRACLSPRSTTYPPLINAASTPALNVIDNRRCYPGQR